MASRVRRSFLGEVCRGAAAVTWGGAWLGEMLPPFFSSRRRAAELALFHPCGFANIDIDLKFIEISIARRVHAP